MFRFCRLGLHRKVPVTLCWSMDHAVVKYGPVEYCGHCHTLFLSQEEYEYVTGCNMFTKVLPITVPMPM